jgi:hypothetical protein
VALLPVLGRYFEKIAFGGMEEWVVMGLRDVVSQSGGDWSTMHQTMNFEGRIHFETY